MPLFNLLRDITDDLRDPGVLWQSLIILACMVFGWALARSIKALFVKYRLTPAVARLGNESFVRVLRPLIVFLALLLARHFLAKTLHIHLIALAIPLAGSLALIRFGFYLLRRVFARHGEAGASMLMLGRIFSGLVWLGVALYITGLWPDLLSYLDETTLPLGRNKISIAAILQAIISVVVMLMLAMWAGAALEERLLKVAGLHSSLRVVLGRTGRAVLILVAVLLSLSMVGIDLTVLSVFGGALGVGLGLGLQKIASNYVSGFIILLDRSLTIGDMITVDKYSGQVTHINTRYTVLQGLDGTESILPNEMLISGAVQNLSLSDKMLWITTQVSVAYDTDLDLILPLLEQAAMSVERVSKTKLPSAYLQRFGADGLELLVGFWIADPENGRSGVTSNVNRAIWKVLQANQVSVPYTQREVRIIGMPALPGPLSVAPAPLVNAETK
ncbi:MAG TPA: mechanosensitive ion channel domain-containing protein [Janthinobacterium sp.]|nr:mechanosensitive ion channel domain-containing protein [Janthinobacterium sp.]